MCVKSSAIVDCLLDRLGIHSDEISQLREAATTLLALTMVVVSSSVLELPFLRADTADWESILKETDSPLTLCGHRRRVAS